jgi:hypothetical protein
MIRPLHILSALLTAALLQAALLGNAGAQSASGNSKDCVDATQKPLTDDEKGPQSGSKNMGITGWSGADRQPSSTNKAEREGKPETDQPATAKGLDPTKDKGSNRPC